MLLIGIAKYMTKKGLLVEERTTEKCIMKATACIYNLSHYVFAELRKSITATL